MGLYNIHGGYEYMMSACMNMRTISYFLRAFQPMTSASDDSSLSSD